MLTPVSSILFKIIGQSTTLGIQVMVAFSSCIFGLCLVVLDFPSYFVAVTTPCHSTNEERGVGKMDSEVREANSQKYPRV